MRRSTGGIGRVANGQITVEFALMFAAIVAVIVFAATNIMKPSLNRFFRATANVIESEKDEVTDRYDAAR